MPLALAVRDDFSPDQLEAMAASVEDRAKARRLRAIAAILRGASRREAASIGGMQRQTLRDWVQKFNEAGPDGLAGRKPPGRPAKLSNPQKDDLMQFLLGQGQRDDTRELSWQLADVAELIKDRYNVELNQISVGRILRSFGLTYDGSVWLKTTIEPQLVMPKSVSNTLEYRLPERKCEDLTS